MRKAVGPVAGTDDPAPGTADQVPGAGEAEAAEAAEAVQATGEARAAAAVPDVRRPSAVSALSALSAPGASPVPAARPAFGPSAAALTDADARAASALTVRPAPGSGVRGGPRRRGGGLPAALPGPGR